MIGKYYVNTGEFLNGQLNTFEYYFNSISKYLTDHWKQELKQSDLSKIPLHAVWRK